MQISVTRISAGATWIAAKPTGANLPLTRLDQSLCVRRATDRGPKIDRVAECMLAETRSRASHASAAAAVGTSGTSP